MSTRRSRFQPSLAGVGERPAGAAHAGPRRRHPAGPSDVLVTRLRTTLLLLAVTGLCLSATLVASASASASLVGEVTEFSTGSSVENHPSRIAVGPEGDLWFTERVTSNIARMTPTGEVTSFPTLLASSAPQGITLGPEGNLWFSDTSNPECNGSGCHFKVGRINPTTHAVEEFTMGITEGAEPWEITTGPDGNLWFTEFSGPSFVGQLARINPVTDEIKQFREGEFPHGISEAIEPAGVTAGPDGNVWFTEQAGDAIGRITPGGTITVFPIPTANSQPVQIVTGSDGNLWFAEQGSLKIGRITPAGVITEFPLSSPDNEPRAIAAGPDGNIWFAMNNGDLGRITPTGVITTCTTGSGGDIEGLTAGPDGSMWFAEGGENRIGKITATGSGLAPNCSSGATPIAAGAPPAAGSNPPAAAAAATASASVRLDGSTLGVLRGVAAVKLSCSGTATCVGKLTLTVKSKPKKGKKAKTETIGTASFSIPAGETKLIRIKLQGTGPALLRTAHGNLSAGLKIAKASPSPSKTETQSVRLKQQKAVQKKKK
jgi:streptogramin lyase